MKRAGGIPFVKISASDNYSFGLKLGRALRDSINARVESNRGFYASKMGGNISKLQTRPNKFLPPVMKTYPNLLVEAKAMAEGAEVRFEELLPLLCEEEVTCFLQRCTSFASRVEDGSIVLCHNEDWVPAYSKNGLVLVKGRLGKRTFLSLGYVGQLPGTSCALNDSGLAFTGNSLESQRYRYGVPRSFMFRALLDCTSPTEAENVILHRPRSICSNMMFVWNSSLIEDIELLWSRYNKFKGTEVLAHTNHPVRKEDQDDKNTTLDSVKRYDRVGEMLPRCGPATVPALKKILCDHVAGVCRHPNGDVPRTQKAMWDVSHTVTVASAVANPSKGWIEVCHSNPCRNRYKKYKL